MKQIVIGFIIGIAACGTVWSLSTGAAHGQSRGDRNSPPNLSANKSVGGAADGGIAGGNTCLGDLDGSGAVGVPDLLILLGAWGPCPCPPGTSDCNGTCIDTTSDPNHCGGCGIDCGVGEICINGQCAQAECTNVSECDDGNPCTTDACVNFQCVFTPTDGLTCDDGSACTVGDTCSGGVCAGVSICGPNSSCAGSNCACDNDFLDCNGDLIDGCETSILSNDSHCGGCDVQCPLGSVCINGSCVFTQTWYRDLDSDGFGDCGDFVTAPVPPQGYVGICGDCDDNSPNVYPGATEFCNNVDDDCNGATDDNVIDCPGSCVNGQCL